MRLSVQPCHQQVHAVPATRWPSLGRASGSGSVLRLETSVPWPSCAYDPDSMGLCLSESENIKEQWSGVTSDPRPFP